MNNIIGRIVSPLLIKTKLSHYTIQYLKNNPIPEQVAEHSIFIVGSHGFNKWIFLKCPCGCGDLLTLSLMKSHYPSWTLNFDWLNRPTLYPSVWKTEGCKSHFWIINGKLRWALRQD